MVKKYHNAWTPQCFFNTPPRTRQSKIIQNGNEWLIFLIRFISHHGKGSWIQTLFHPISPLQHSSRNRPTVCLSKRKTTASDSIQHPPHTRAWATSLEESFTTLSWMICQKHGRGTRNHMRCPTIVFQVHRLHASTQRQMRLERWPVKMTRAEDLNQTSKHGCRNHDD